MLPVIMLLCFQSQADPVRPLDEVRLKQGAELEKFDRERKTIMLLQQREFEDRFRELSVALGEFSEEYNENKGQVWPKKKAEAVDKAIRRLESTYVWRRGIERKKR